MSMPRRPEKISSSEKQNDIVLLFCPFTGRLPPHTFEINLGAAYLAAFLRQRGFTSLFFVGEYNNDPAFNQVIAFINAHRPRSVGFTVYGSNVPETVALCRVIKSRFPHIPILWGGPDVRFRSREFLATYGDCIDILVVGEGEKPLLKLFTGKRWSKELLVNIPGIVFQDKEIGAYFENKPETTLLQDCSGNPTVRNPLDVYPSPYLQEILPETYIRKRLSFGVLSSRGCPYHCIYCQFSALQDHKVYFHSVERLLSEIRWIHNRMIKLALEREEIFIQVLDDIFTMARSRVEAFCKGIMRENYQIKVKFGMNTRADHVDEALIRTLSKAGFVHVNFGLESAVPRVLKVIRKVSGGLKNDEQDLEKEQEYLRQTKRAVAWSKKAGLKTTVSIIAGLPTERLRHIRKTLQFVEALDLDSYTHNFLTLLEGTELAGRRREFGYEWCDNFPGYLGKYGHRFTKTPFPSRRVSPLKNAKVFRSDSKRFSILLRGASYSGFLTQSSIPRHGWFPFVLRMKPGAHSLSSMGGFFEHFSGLSVSLFFPERGVPAGERLENLMACLPMKMAAMYECPDTGSLKFRIQGVEEADLSTPYLIPLKDLGFRRFPDDGRKIFCCLDDEVDFHCLKGLFLKWSLYGKKEWLPQKGVNIRVDFYEYCRWKRSHGRGCSADSLTHLHVDGDGRIFPCTHFPSMGRVEENCSLKTLRKRIQTHKKETENARGCADCPASEICPKCPAPYPLSHVLYCKFQRSMFLKAMEDSFRLFETDGPKN